MSLFEFWSRLPVGDTVHPDDRPYFDGRSHSYQFDLPPGHISGPLRTAPVILCYGNPGYDEGDRSAAKDPSKLELLSRQAEGCDPYPIWLPGWKKWITENTKQIGLSPECLSRTVATFNVVPYASVDMDDPEDRRIAEKLPSVDAARRYLHEVLIPKARRDEIFLVVIRKHALWRVDSVQESATLRIPRNIYRRGALGAMGHDIRRWLDGRSNVRQTL